MELVVEPRAQEREREDEFGAALSRCFTGIGPDGVPRVRLEQVGDSSFALVEELAYRCGPSPEPVRVVPGDLHDGVTDLASVPRSLTWFVPRYGRHTAAALLHDVLLDRASRKHREDPSYDPRPAYEAADATFRQALHSLGVPPLRRTTMWAAVVFGTRKRVRSWVRVALLAWLTLAAGGMATLAWAASTGRWGVAAVAALAPVPASALWGRQYVAGLVAGLTAVVVVVPTLTGLVVYGLFQLAEAAIAPFDRSPMPGPRPRTWL